MNLKRLRENWESVQARIHDAEQRTGRPQGAVRLVSVTKRCPNEWVAALVDLGARDLGENYPQELWAKVEALPNPEIRWHLIGHLQGNKAKRTYPLVRMVHAVDSLKLLHTLRDLGAALPEPAGLCLQVNTSGEPSKHGWDEATLLADAEAIAEVGPRLVVGLMTMAALGTDAETARPSFVRLRTLAEKLRERTGLPLPELSMGMSNDFETAIEEGATLVRVGSALFDGVDQ